MACTTLKSAVVDAMPTASAAMVQIVKSGVRNNTRTPWRRSGHTLLIGLVLAEETVARGWRLRTHG